MVLVLVIGVSLVVVFGMLKLADIAFRDPKPENMIQKDKVDLSYNPLAVEWDVNIPNHPGSTPESRQHMYDVLTGAKPPGPNDRLVTISGAEIERVLEQAGAQRRQDLRYNPLSVDEDVCMPVRPPSNCLVCGDPMKRETVGQAVVETCDCPNRGYQPRS